MAKSKKMFCRKRRGILITKLMARDGTDCKLCGDPLDRHIKDPNDPMYITLDRIIAGGLYTFENVQLAHRFCNEKRGDAPLPLDEEDKFLANM